MANFAEHWHFNVAVSKSIWDLSCTWGLGGGVVGVGGGARVEVVVMVLTARLEVFSLLLLSAAPMETPRQEIELTAVYSQTCASVCLSGTSWAKAPRHADHAAATD